MAIDRNLLSLVGQDAQLRKVATTKGGEYAGPCPWCGGTDRLRVWPEHKGGQWWCRQCNKGGDAIAYLVERGSLTPKEAGELRRGVSGTNMPDRRPSPRPPAPRHPDTLAAPPTEWQQAARAFVENCKAELWTEPGRRALDWLRVRGLSDGTIRAAALGYNPKDQWPERQRWGLGDGRAIWLPRGIVIPWEIGGELWRVNIRRPQGGPKYYSPAGHSNALYNADALTYDKPAVLVEGELDALTLGQVAGDLVAPVATGSTSGARRPRWIAALALCPRVLVSFDAEEDKGDKAAAWWVELLDNGERWRPLWADANAMHQDGADLRGWVLAALDPGPTLDQRLDALQVATEETAQRLDALEVAHLPEREPVEWPKPAETAEIPEAGADSGAGGWC